VYFGGQAVVLGLLFLLNSDASDAFNFLFYILTFHAAVVLSIRMATIWTGIYFVIASSVSLISRGWDGLYAVFFYLAVFIVCTILGNTVQQTELTSERNQSLVDELKETQQKLQELAVVEERNRLARDLHDSVKQQVFAISMQLSAARTALSPTDKAYSSVVEAERLAQQAGAELTTLISALRPPALESKTLANAMSEHVDAWSRQNNIAYELDIDSTVSISQQTEQALFRVLQEALANVSRHSKASQVMVTLRSQDDTVALVVEDNGAGYDAKHNKRGVGLDSMRERLMAVNGTLEVSSLKSQGTSVIATVRRS
ncbi:MAG TPA: sensor histidine kinase, partial [Anaerolineales bacterium]|nr:sensor histidine kinase [Anaerolineales bacterium]